MNKIGLIIGGIVVAIILLIGGISIYKFSFTDKGIHKKENRAIQNNDVAKSINSFEECAKVYPIMESYPEQCAVPGGKTFIRELTDDEVLKPSGTAVALVAMSGTSSFDKLVEKETFGCGDKVVMIYTGKNMTPEEALETLFTYTDNEEENYNVFQYSKNLAVNNLDIKNGLATVKLSGTLVAGGTCDTPRFTAQINRTLKQFNNITDTEIFINGESLDDYLSEKG